MPQSILCVGTRICGRVFKFKPCLLSDTCCKKFMLIEFLRWAVNLTPILRSPSIPQTPTHRLPAIAERSYEVQQKECTSVLWTGYGMHIDDSTFVSRHRQKIFFSSDVSSPVLGSIQPPIQRVIDTLPKSFASSSEVKNDQGYASNSRYAFDSFIGTSLL
jgi:hypothetical protein